MHGNGNIEKLGNRNYANVANVEAGFQRVRKKKKMLADLGYGSAASRVLYRTVASAEAVTYHLWGGQGLSGQAVAIDTETELIDVRGDGGPPPPVPRLVLASVSSGKEHYLVSPDKLGAFLQQHADRVFVAHNWAFDALVIAETLGHEAEPLLVAIDDFRVRDTKVLAELLWMYRHVREPATAPRGAFTLESLVREHLGVELEKDSYRTRYAEIAGRDLRYVLREDQGWGDYAVLDAVSTYQLYTKLWREMKRELKPLADRMDPTFEDQFGLMCEAIQVQTAISCEVMRRFGVHIDVRQMQGITEELFEKTEELARNVERMSGGNLFKRSKRKKELVYNASGSRQLRVKECLQPRLEEIAEQYQLDVPLTKSGITTKRSEWDAHIDTDPFIQAWLEYKDAVKQLDFCKYAKAVEYPRFKPYVLTSRMACSRPNLQQLPKKPFRKAVVPCQGHVFICADFSFVELVTMAAHCLFRYGRSKLAETIKAGIDPHALVAARVLGVAYEEFLELKQTDPDKYASLRQPAKIVNFGVGGGLGPAGLVRNARSKWGIDSDGRSLSPNFGSLRLAICSACRFQGVLLSLDTRSDLQLCDGIIQIDPPGFVALLVQYPNQLVAANFRLPRTLRDALFPSFAA